MIPLILFALIAAVVVVFLAVQGWHYLRPTDAGSAAQLTAVDLEAFANLTDPEEDRYLRVNLASSDFRSVQRERIRAAKLYVVALSQNAGKLVRAGQAARLDPNPVVAAAGTEIVHKAIRLKIWCLLSLWRLQVALVFPGLTAPAASVASRYQHVIRMAESLSRKVAA